MSPVLFCIYMDELLCRVKQKGVGCYIGDVFMGCFCYADDLSILAPSVAALKIMLSVCEEFADEYNVTYNASKSALLLYNAPVRKINVCLNSCAIPVCQSAVHLGTVVGTGSECDNVSKAVGNLVYRTNLIITRYGFCDRQILLKLFDSYCTSYYGSPLWDLSYKGIHSMEIAWRKCMRRLLHMNTRTRSRYIPLIVGKPDVYNQLLDRFARFHNQCCMSKNVKVRLVTQILPMSSSTVADNLRMLRYKRSCTESISVEDVCTVNTINELYEISTGSLLSPLSKQEAKSLMDLLATS